MSVDRSDIEQVAELARLRIEDNSVDELVSKITSILGMIDQMQATNTDDIEPLANPLEASQRLRADVVSEADQREALQANAPATEAGLFLVPKVID